MWVMIRAGMHHVGMAGPNVMEHYNSIITPTPGLTSQTLSALAERVWLARLLLPLPSFPLLPPPPIHTHTEYLRDHLPGAECGVQQHRELDWSRLQIRSGEGL